MKHIYNGILLFCLSLAACKKDELGSKDLLVYMSGDYGSATSTVTVPFLHTPVDVFGNTSVSVVASATRNVSADVQLTITPDTSLVAAYNQANKTSCLPLPAANYKIVNSGTRTITAGGVVSDSLQLQIVDPSTLLNPGGYLLPLSITSITGKDKGVQISTNRKTAFVNITYQFNNIVATEIPLTGTLASRTSWGLTVSNTTSGALGPAMVDGNNSTAWRSSNSSTAAKYVIVNMKSVQAIKGLQLVPDYVTTTENPTQIQVSTSSDSTVWTVQGLWTGTGPATGSTAANPSIKGINLIAPVQAKFFRLDILAQVSGSRAGIGELNVVQ